MTSCVIAAAVFTVLLSLYTAALIVQDFFRSLKKTYADMQTRAKEQEEEVRLLQSAHAGIRRHAALMNDFADTVGRMADACEKADQNAANSAPAGQSRSSGEPGKAE